MTARVGPPATRPMRLPPFLLAMRPQQWSKNVFVLAALLFAWGDRRFEVEGGVWEEAVVHVLLAFGAFCLGSSAIYVLNDILDAAQDRLHPDKRHRPIASGALSVSAAWMLCIGCALGGAALSWWAGPVVSLLLLAYVVMNIAYSLHLKRVVLLDVFCIAGGFLFRVAAGGEAANFEISSWLFLCTLFLALFLALNKRRSEIALMGDGKERTRAILREYPLPFLDQMVTVLAACTILCYAVYTADADTALKYGEGNHLSWSVPFVVFGVARYMLLVQSGTQGDNPTRVFLAGDKLFLLNNLAWLAVVTAAIAGWI